MRIKNGMHEPKRLETSIEKVREDIQNQIKILQEKLALMKDQEQTWGHLGTYNKIHSDLRDLRLFLSNQ